MFKKLLNKKSLLSLALVLTMLLSMAGLASASPVNPHANTTTDLSISLNGTYQSTLSSTDIDSLSTSDVRHYSALNNGNKNVYYTTKGSSLQEIIAPYTNLSDLVSIQILSSDNYLLELSKAELFGNFNYFPALGGPSASVPTTIGTSAMGGIVDPSLLDNYNTLRLFVGQDTTTDVNNPKLAKWIQAINIKTI